MKASLMIMMAFVLLITCGASAQQRPALVIEVMDPSAGSDYPIVLFPLSGPAETARSVSEISHAGIDSSGMPAEERAWTGIIVRGGVLNNPLDPAGASVSLFFEYQTSPGITVTEWRGRSVVSLNIQASAGAANFVIQRNQKILLQPLTGPHSGIGISIEFQMVSQN